MWENVIKHFNLFEYQLLNGGQLMYKNGTTKEMVLSGLLLATGIILPMIFHVFGMTGPVFLPMHIPVLLGGMLLSPALALILGIITPISSSIFTGMPVLFPMAVIMAFELGTYGLVSSLAVRKLRLNTFSSLLIAMVSGRIVAGLSVNLLTNLFGVNMNPIIYIKGALLTGIPGLIIQLIFLPSIVYAIDRYCKKSYQC